MNNQRKRQKTRMSTNSEGNRQYAAVDMGWGDVWWAKLKSQAMIDAITQILPLAWKIVNINYTEEDAFTKSLERDYKKFNSKPRYLLIHTQSSKDSEIQSWFFIHDILSGPKELSYTEATKINSQKALIAIWKFLFDVKMHPSKKGMHRYSISPALHPDMVEIRMEYLIKLARKGGSHPLAESVKPKTDFETGLARYLKADNPLIYHLKPLMIFLTLKELEHAKKLITKDEVIKVMQKFLKESEYTTEGVFEGLPKHGSERDEKEGKFIIYRGKNSSLSVRVGKKSPWDFEGVPKVEDGEEFIE